MKDYLDKLPKELCDLIYYAGDIASRKNMPVYLVGGFVRDLILGFKNLDVDIVVEGDGISFAEDFSGRLKARLIRHRRFGTATVIVKPQLKIDISTARKEFYPEPAHLPVVSAGTLRDDLFRRDFTINAMAIGIGTGNFGRLIDLFGGKDDLRNKKVRILHDLSFIDDPTRILRAVRFEQRYGFNIEAGTLKDLKEAVKLKLLQKVEAQRIRDDLVLMLKEKNPLKEIRRMEELAGFSFISPQLSGAKKSYALLSSVRKEIEWFSKMHAQRRSLDAWLIYFMGLTEPLDIKELARLSRKFAFRRGEEKRMLAYKGFNHKSVLLLSRTDIRPSEVFALFEPLSYEVILLLKAKYKNPYFQRHIRNFFKVYNGTRIHICGHDLHNLGIAPGPGYQKVFTKVLNAKLDGLVKTKKEELSLIKRSLRIR
jgi:tRNA nucleotidyltransferase (CCA-adding enzyme)